MVTTKGTIQTAPRL